MIHIYCGNGKGKTTAALGLAVRFAGRFGCCGGRVIIARFLKDENSGELQILRSVPGITVIENDRSFGFTWKMTEEQKKEAAEYYSGLLKKACEMAMVGLKAKGSEETVTEIMISENTVSEDHVGCAHVLLVLDEAMAAVNSGLVSEDQLVEVMDQLTGAANNGDSDAPYDREDLIEVVLTGRNPSERLKNMADYISCIEAEKHPFEKGVAAREGIEY